MIKNSFRSFVEGRLSGNSVRQAAASRVVPIGGFTPGQKRGPSIFGEATKTNVRTPKMPILFDESDIRFLLQFPPGKWPNALAWRYGEGLRYASLERKKSGAAPETGTITLAAKGRGKPMTFQNVQLHMGPLLDKLITPIHEGGDYGFDLDHWKEITMEAKTPKGEKRLVTPNYLGLLKSTAAGAVHDWKGAIPTGLLGDPAKDSVLGTASAGPGKPATGVGFLYDGTIANYSAAGGIVKPLYSQAQLSGMIDAKVGATSDGAAVVDYTYQMGDKTASSQEKVSTLLPGKMFSQGRLNNFATSRLMLQALITKAFETNPELMSEPSLKPEQIAESLPKGKILEFGKKRIEVPYDSFMDLYGQSNEELQETKDAEISLSDYRAEERATGTGPGVVSKGKYKPSQMTKGKEPISDADLKRIGYTRAKYTALIDKYFIAISPQNTNVMGLDGSEIQSIILQGIDHGIKTAEGQYNPLHVDRLRESKSIMYMNVRGLIKKQNGKGPFVSFAEALKEGDSEHIEMSYQDAKRVVMGRTSNYVAEVAQLDLGYGTRRKPKRGESLDAPMKSGKSKYGTFDIDAADALRGGGKYEDDDERKIVTGIKDGKITFAYQSGEMWAKADRIQKDKKKDIEGGNISQIAKESQVRTELEVYFMSQYVLEKDLEESEYDMAAIKNYARTMSNRILAKKGLTLIRGTPDIGGADEKRWLAQIVKNQKTIDSVKQGHYKPMFAPDFGEETQQTQAGQQQRQAAPSPEEATPEISHDVDFNLPTADMFRHPDDVKDYINAPAFTQGVSSQGFIEKLRTNPQEMAKAKQLNAVLQSQALAAAIAKAGEQAGAA